MPSQAAHDDRDARSGLDGGPGGAGALVRPAREADLDGVLALYGELAGGAADSLPAKGPQAQAVLRLVLQDERRVLLVADREGQVVGTADLLVVPNLTHHGSPWAVVENVVVARSARRTGVAREMMDYLVRHAAAAGCYKVQLMSRKDRAEAHQLYTALGFAAAAEGFRLYLDAHGGDE